MEIPIKIPIESPIANWIPISSSANSLATGVGCQRAGSADAARVEDLKKDAAFRQWIGLAAVHGGV